MCFRSVTLSVQACLRLFPLVCFDGSVFSDCTHACTMIHIYDVLCGFLVCYDDFYDDRKKTRICAPNNWLGSEFYNKILTTSLPDPGFCTERLQLQHQLNCYLM